MGWTEFWHAWVHHLLDERDRTREAQNWSLWGALLPHTKDQQTLWSELSSGRQREALTLITVMYWDLPLSVRRLLKLPTREELDAAGLHNVDPDTGEILDGLDWWERQAERTSGEPGSEAAHAFYAAAMRAAEQARAAREEEDKVEESPSLIRSLDDEE